ncbi:MAG: hypothetical protein COV66_12660 [Nitrospinae bacterium CG11_big_fil_rev_8_21_14_0_20_45_15]|nr:MAG: hypothetical protein COV66_12660 [Nitrospinae bacterium CG11_big_fil_rev_8_21_14_0_20_45_15]
MQFDKETQVRILRVAADRIDGRPIGEVDARIAHIMDMHPEFEESWQLGEMAVYPQEINGQIVNPFVHTVLHVIIDTQLNDGNPEIVPSTFKKLMDQGMTEHECLHGIIHSYADIHFSSFRSGKPFDHLDYQSRLKALSYDDVE